MRETKARDFPLQHFYSVEGAWEKLKKICYAVSVKDTVIGIMGSEDFPYVFLESTNSFLEWTAHAAVPTDVMNVSMKQAEDFWFGMVASVVCLNKRFQVYARRRPLVILSRSRLRTTYYKHYDEWARSVEDKAWTHWKPERREP